MKNHTAAVRPLLFFAFFIVSVTLSIAQNYTSSGNGSWTTGSNWAGGTSPSLSTQSWGTINVNHNLVVSGNYNLPGGSINISSGKTLTINGDLTMGLGGGGNNINVSGILNISGNVKLYANLNILPGGKVVVDGSVTVVSSTYLKVGTNVAPPAYADLVIKQNLNSETSGDILVERNGRMAVYGNFVNSGSTGGTRLTVNNGGQVYFHGNINLTGNGGDAIVNNNSTSPYGLYVNGTITNSGGGSSTTANKGDKTTMENTNPAFYSWVESQSESPLPVELLFFKGEINAGRVVLKWATSSELNFDYFIVEKSIDGNVFTSIAHIRGHGTTQERNDYSFVDEDMVATAYYRLKSVDFDGYEEYFNVVRMELKLNKVVSVYPNPVTDGHITISLNFIPQNGIVIVTDLMGNTVYSQHWTEGRDKQVFPIMLEPGAYLVRFVAEEHPHVTRILVK